MKGYITNIEQSSVENENYRKVLYTTPNSQLVLMSLKSGEEIGSEIHHLDQFIRIEKGLGKAILNDVEHEISDGWAIVVPAGTKHNIINTGGAEMKLYTVYSPPNHKDGTLQPAKADEVEEHYDGQTTPDN